MQSKKIGLFVALGAIGVTLILAIIFFSLLVPNIGSSSSHVSFSSSKDRIDVLPIEGAIGPTTTGLFSEATYDHDFILSTLNDLIDDPHSKGLILFIDSPGGAVYQTDEVYLKLLDYKATGRPIYASFGSLAASGGYYLGCSADKIVCNRNTLTGSIGVIMGSVVDMSGLLDNLGIKVETITAGDNKAMGNSYEPLTDEQRTILQNLLKETHEQFILVVAKGRHLDLETTRKLADGRIYTAKQALESGLVDTIGNLDDTIALMQADYRYEDLPVNTIDQLPPSFLDSLMMKVQSLRPQSDLELLTTLQNTFNRYGYYYDGNFSY